MYFFYRKNRVNIKISAFSENSKTKKTRLVLAQDGF
jgi:hypothetical protein